MNVRFCPACKSLILVDFRFCPYCGAVAAKGPELVEALDAPFEKMGTMAVSETDAKADVFANAQESLERLESDMDLILEELAKDGRSSS